MIKMKYKDDVVTVLSLGMIFFLLSMLYTAERDIPDWFLYSLAGGVVVSCGIFAWYLGAVLSRFKRIRKVFQ